MTNISTITDAVGCGLVIVTQEDTVASMNPRARQHLRIQPADEEALDESGSILDMHIVRPATSSVFNSPVPITPWDGRQPANVELAADPAERAPSANLREMIHRARSSGQRVTEIGHLSWAAPGDSDSDQPHTSPPLAISAAPADNHVVITLQRTQAAAPTQTRSNDSFSQDVTLADRHLDILEMIAQGASLSTIAGEIVHLVQSIAPSLTGIVLRHDPDSGTLRHAASPSISPNRTAPLETGVAIESCTLCHSAVATRSRVHHDLGDASTLQSISSTWQPLLDEVDAATGWSLPIMKSDTDVLGALIVLSQNSRSSFPLSRRHVDLVTHLLRITLERDRRREALRLKNEQFRQLTESMQEVFVLRTTDQILYVSPSFEDVWGCPPDFLYEDANAYEDDIHPDDLPRVRASYNVIVEEQRPIDIRYRMTRRSDGETRWVSASFHPVQSSDHDPRFAGIIRDVTEAHENKLQLEQSEETYRDLIDHASDAIYVQDASGRFLDLSRGAIEMYGYSREEMIGQTPAFVSAPGRNDLDLLDERFNRALNGEPQRFEFWGERADGSVFPKEVRLQRATYFGQPVVVAFALDITDRKAAEEALRNSEERYRLVIQNMKEVVMLHDVDGETLWASPSVEDVFGLTPAEAKNQNIFDIIHPSDLGKVESLYEELAAGTFQGPITYRVQHADGHYIWLETLVQAGYDENGLVTRIQSSSRDVSDRVQRQRELRRAKREAEDADRLKSAMLANMSHEIRTPLTSVIGFAEILRHEVAPEHRRFTELIYDGSRRLMQTLDSVLQLSKLEAGLVNLDASPINLKTEIQETVDLLRPQAERNGVDLRVDLESDSPVRGDWDQGAMHRILNNLIGNAIKFTDEGGAVTVLVRTSDQTVRLMVRDTGIGIDASFLPHIFEPFKQETGGLRRRYDGSGLGLAIVQRLVEMMDGTIDVDSEKGAGTTFTIALPLSDNTGS
ncbi:hypothetical protein CRI94_11230 [Longibacter salinarum]|uniref:histidine kinase n=1 Tax=Longibacter salinarum TaxID=1850348 RepID=A0A2A8CX32_9BACT|nr:PAS domain S-box protein [Longibacter salinarum]PEN13206.1 hypothetical protein CRI94_11230 [Longibacter salinarum]